MVQQQAVNSSCEYKEAQLKSICGQKWETNEWNTVEWITEKRQEHELECNACKIISGESKRKKGLRQHEIAILFDNKLFGYSSSTGNYESDDYDGCPSITHYGTIEAIWTKFGKQIENSQCWSAGFAKCSGHKEDYRLPLSIIRSRIGNIYSIEVFDYDNESHWDTKAVFRIEDRYFLLDSDENNRFIAELVTPAYTIQEAYETMKPQLVKESQEVKRQGEYFFISTHLSDEEVSFKTSAMFETVPKYIETNNVGTISYRDIEEYGNRGFYELSEEEQKQFLELIKTVGVVTKRKYVPQLEKDSNHVVQHKGIHLSYTVVKGYVRHVNRDHQKLDLGNVWHVVVKNTVKQAFQVTNRGSGGFD